MTTTKSTAASSKAGSSISLGGKKFTVNTKLPMRFGLAVQDENLREIVLLLLGKDQAKEFWALDISFEELPEIINKLVEKTGVSLGES